MLIAHLSDLHLKEPGDLSWLNEQLRRVAARSPIHLAVTGDLLDRWDTELLEGALDAFATHGFMHAERLTIFHGNHDLASSGGHPRTGADIRRLVLRFWDPPPLVRWRRRRFYAAIDRRAPAVAARPPVLKILQGVRLAVVDTVPIPWRPVSFNRGVVTVRHAIGCVRQREMSWLAALRGADPLILLVHHYPLDAPQFDWTPDRPDFESGSRRLLKRFVREVSVPMAIPEPDRSALWSAAEASGVRLVLCGHVHRARFDWKGSIAVGLNGQSGAAWANHTIAFYEIDAAGVRMELEEIRE